MKCTPKTASKIQPGAFFNHRNDKAKGIIIFINSEEWRELVTVRN